MLAPFWPPYILETASLIKTCWCTIWRSFYKKYRDWLKNIYSTYSIFWASCFLYVLLSNKWTFLPSLVPIGSVVSEKKIKNRQHSFWHLWVSFLCTSNQQKKPENFQRIIQRSFLLNLVPIGTVVSERKI